MLRCNDCRPLILDHLYGLLDDPEAAAVATHLASCPACAAERTEAARVQGLIATAAKGEFPLVRFEAPGTQTRGAPSELAKNNAQPRPALASPPDSRGQHARPGFAPGRFGTWLPWAVAAAVLLAIPGTVVPVLGLLNKSETARHTAETSTAKLETVVAQFEQIDRETNQRRDEARKQFAIARQTHDGLLANWVRDEKASLQSQDARKLTWDVLKPASLQPGAPNEFLLVVRDRGATPTGRVLAEVRDQTDAVVYSQPIDYEKKRDRDHTMRLPARVWEKLTPQSELFLVVSSVDEKTGAKTELQEKVRLLGPVFATVLTTDKPVYRPGETVYLRSLTLDRVTFTPPAREQLLRFELLSPNGHPVVGGVVAGGTDLVRVNDSHVENILGPDGKPLRGVGTATFPLPADAADGDYTLILRELPHPAGYPPAVPFPVTRPLKVRSGASDAYRKEIGYAAAASYAPGDTVEAWAELRLQDKPVEGAEVSAVAVADNRFLETVPVRQPVTGPDGRANFRFTLPPDLDRADVRLKVTFKTRTGEEMVADRVPVVGKNLVVEFFPEGGDLVGGLESRVYFRATTPAGQPVDITGVVTDGRKVLANVATLTDPAERGANRGIGSFTFTPELGIPVWLKLKTPAGAYVPLLVPERGRFPAAQVAVAGGAAVAGSRTGFLLPEPKTQGVVIAVRDPVTAPGQPIRVLIRSKGDERNLVVGAYTRGRLSDTKRLKVTGAPGEVSEVQLMAGTDPRGGVVRITVFEEPAATPDSPNPDLVPVAERLVFRKPGETLNLKFTPAGANGAVGFPPGSPVELNLTATDEKGKPAAAVLYAAVVNSGLAPAAQDRRLTTHFLLAGEINTPDGMEHADFLLTNHPKAGEALDLVLATQGWRRFVEQTHPGFVQKPVVANADCANLLVSNGQYGTWTEPPGLRDQRKLRETYLPRFETAVKALEAARENVEAVEADRSGEQRARELAAEVQASRDEAKALADEALAAAVPVERFRGAGWFAVAAFGLLAVLLGTAALIRVGARLPLGIGSAGAVGLVAFLVVALGMAERTQASQPQDVLAKLPDLRRLEAALATPEIAPEPRPAAPATTFEMFGKVDTKPDVLGDAKGSVVVGAPVPGGPKSPPKGGLGLPAPGGGGLGGVGGQPAAGLPPVGLVPAPPVLPVVAPPGDKTDPKTSGKPSGGPNTVAIAPPAPAGLPAPPGTLAPGGGGFALPQRLDGGWQPYSGNPKKLVPDDLLPRDPTFAPIRDQIAGRMTGATALGEKGVGAVVEAVTKAAENQLRETEKARQHAQVRATALRDQMKDALERKLKRTDLPPLVVAPGALKKNEPLLPDALALDRVLAAVPAVTPLVVREFAVPRPGSDAPDDRVEPDTVLWQPVIVLPADGRAKLTFSVGQAPGGYRVIVAGHTLDGRIGAIEGNLPVAGPARSATAPPVPPPANVGPNKP